MEKPPTTGGQIEPIKTGGVFDWLANTFGIQQVRAAAASWLNLKVNVNITLPNGTVSNTTARPVIAENSSVLTLPVDLSQSGLLMSGSGSSIIPFTIYQIENLTDSADSYRTFQIRDGVVSARSKYYTGSSGVLNLGTASLFNNNFEQLLLVYQDGQGYGANVPNNSASPAGGGVVNLANLADVQITNHQQIVLADYDDSGGNYDWQASFFVEIVDDATKGLSVKLWGRMFNNNGVATTQSSAWPVGDNYIPLGYVRITGGTTAEFYQFQTGDLINRYPLNRLNDRGRWSTDSLSGQLFYPNDIVHDNGSNYLSKTTSGGQTISYNGRYQYIYATPAICTTAPHSDSTHWRYYAAVI